MTRLNTLLTEIRACRVCEPYLPLGPRPVFRASTTARVLLVGQAPGRRVHETGIPWNDPSGDRLRVWMGMTREQFYDEKNIAIVPSGFCYPGSGPRGDAPPRPECAPLWHPQFSRADAEYSRYAFDRHLCAGLLPIEPTQEKPMRNRASLSRISPPISSAAPSQPAQPTVA